jgi:hypothetical protein
MDFAMLERRRDPRTQAFVPITLRYDDQEEDVPAHLLDLSEGGAALLTTSHHAPALGQHVDLQFETPNSDGGSESHPRREVGIVIHVRRPEKGVARVGIRFLQRPDIHSGLFGPRELLSMHRKGIHARPKAMGDRWMSRASGTTAFVGGNKLAYAN